MLTKQIMSPSPDGSALESRGLCREEHKIICLSPNPANLADPIPAWEIFYHACPGFIPSLDGLAASHTWWSSHLLLYSCWCTRNPPVACPGGNTRRCSQTPLTREPQRFQGILGDPVGLCLYQHIIWIGSIHDGIVFHDTVHTDYQEQRKQWHIIPVCTQSHFFFSIV